MLGRGIFPSPRDYMKVVLGISPSPKTHIDMGVPNPIYIDIFLHIFDIILHISHIFSHIFDIFLHIFDICLHIFHKNSFIFSSYFFLFLAYSFLFWHIPSYFWHNIFYILFLYISFIFVTSRNSRIDVIKGRRGCARYSGNYRLGGLGIFSNVTSSGGGGGGCNRKSWYYIAGHKTWNVSKMYLSQA